MPQKSDSFTASKKSYRRRVLLALGVIAGVAVYNKDAIADNLNFSSYPKPNEIEYDVDGNPMYLMKGEELESLLQSQSNAMSLFADTSVIPYHFWTKRTARGHNDGRGLEAGSDYFVLKSHDGRYMSENWGGHVRYESRLDLMEKWTYEPNHGSPDGQVAIRNSNGRYMRCDSWKMYVDRDHPSRDEMFYIYKTASCGDGLPEGNECLAIRALSGHRGSWVKAQDDWVWCDGENPDVYSKWHGWNQQDWTVESITYDFNAATESASQPIILG